MTLLLFSTRFHVPQNDRKRANSDTADRERQLEERQRDIQALVDKVSVITSVSLLCFEKPRYEWPLFSYVRQFHNTKQDVCIDWSRS